MHPQHPIKAILLTPRAGDSAQNNQKTTSRLRQVKKLSKTWLSQRQEHIICSLNTALGSLLSVTHQFYVVSSVQSFCGIQLA